MTTTTATKCTHTGKVLHTNKRTAILHLRDLERRKGARDLNIYRCGEHYHVGHSVIALSKRIRASLRSGRAHG